MVRNKKEKNKDKFDENIKDEPMGPVDNEGVSEESGMNKKNKGDKTSSGEGIEEFRDDTANFKEGKDEKN